METSVFPEILLNHNRLRKHNFRDQQLTAWHGLALRDAVGNSRGSFGMRGSAGHLESLSEKTHFKYAAR
jgi:hypothetical protein